MNLAPLLNNLITSGRALTDPDTLQKHKALNIFHVVLIIIAPAAGLFFRISTGDSLLLYASIAAAILMAAGIFFLRKTGDILFCGNYAIFILWALISIISWRSGAISIDGIINPSWILNAGLILFAIFLNGYFSGTVWAALTFIQTGAIIFLFRKGHLFSSTIPPEIAATYYMGTYLISLLIILLFAFLFEKEKSEAMLREQGKSQTIRESKKYMDDIFDRYPLPTFILDKQHRVIQWNRACTEISGISGEDVLGKRVWEGFYMSGQEKSMADIMLEDIALISGLYKEEIVSSDSGWFELSTSLPGLHGGTRVIITAAPVYDDNGDIRGAIQTIQEMKHIQIEDGVQDYLDESFPRAVFKMDVKGKITFWNRACTELFGFDENEMTGQAPLDIVEKNYHYLFKSIFVKAFKGESFPDQELMYVSKQNNPVYVIARIFSCHNPEKELEECVFINTDITAIQLKALRLKQLLLDSREKYQALSEEHDLLKKNLSSFIRKKDSQQAG
ncbi:MAG: PAS domain S-box protein [Deltaproteobacteria bacterium]|jgi:PAS domain S-box-containing protein|nr:PAS domain S-box protein [Deltaproteobacteria bacterium]